MLPVNSRFSKRIVTNFFYRATKRCLLGQRQISSTNAANSTISEPADESHQLATQYFNQFPNYCQMVTDAKSRAKRSILIDHCGFERLDIDSELENVERIYSIVKETRRGLTKLSLIEFKSEDDANNIAKRAGHNEGLLAVPLKILQYRGPSSTRESTSLRQNKSNYPVETTRLSYKREMSDFDSYSELVANNSMSLVALKMRFITLVNLERILCSGIFEEYEIMPFGSSVIDLGCDSGDLDLIVTRKDDHQKVVLKSLQEPHKLHRPSKPVSNLVHLDKSLYSESNNSTGSKAAMRWFDNTLREYMPLTDGYGVLFIHRAKVPIIKFTSRITSIDCDLSFNLGLDHRAHEIVETTYSGILMSQILYSLCRNNNLFYATAVYLRILARLTSITSKTANAGLTNFQFLSLIIFYLQQVSIVKNELKKSVRNQAIVPSFEDLMSSKSPQPINLDQEQLNRLLSEVVSGFFEYYSRFNFARDSLNLFHSKVEKKLDNSSLFVLNPLDKTSNICYNVNSRSLDNFVKQIRLNRNKCPLNLMKSLLKNHQKLTPKSRDKVSLTLEEMFSP